MALFKKNKANQNIVYKPINHIAFIMDGNGRWAKRRGLPRSMGHREGCKRIKETAFLCEEFNIKVMSLFCFSTENWKRDQKEIDYLFNLLETFFRDEIDELNEHHAKVVTLGDLTRLPTSAQEAIRQAKEITKNNDGLILNICLNYGGQDEIVNAAIELATKVKKGTLSISDINKSTFESAMESHDLPPIDVLVRTSGEMRISNFMLYEAAYAEFVFIDDHWPDFKRPQFLKVLEEYSKRDRRFGGIKYESK